MENIAKHINRVIPNPHAKLSVAMVAPRNINIKINIIPIINPLYNNVII